MDFNSQESSREIEFTESIGGDLLMPSEALSCEFQLPDEDTVSRLSESNDEVVRRYGFELENLGLLLPVDTKSEVTEDLPFCRLPNSPPWILGIGSMRGIIVPLYDLSIMFGLNSQKLLPHKVLVVSTARDVAVGLIISDLPEPVLLKQEYRLKNDPPLPIQLRQFLRGCYDVDGSIWIDWNIPEFFTSVAMEI